VPAGETRVAPGDLCAIEPYVNCGRCGPCRLGRPNCCESLRLYGLHIDGGMQPLLNVPARLLHKSKRLSPDQLALIETLGIGAHAVARSGLDKGESALVVGAGPIGLAVTQFAIAAGAHVRVVEINETRRNFIARLGVETLAGPDERLADVVFDATGAASVMAKSLELVTPAGRLVFVGVCPEPVPISDPVLHKREITIYASRNSCHQFPRIIRMIEDGLIDTSPWITHRLRLADVPRELPELPGRPGLVKAIVEVDDSDL